MHVECRTTVVQRELVVDKRRIDFGQMAVGKVTVAVAVTLAVFAPAAFARTCAAVSALQQQQCRRCSSSSSSGRISAW